MFREDKNLYETIFNILPDVVLLIDKKGILIGVNSRMEDWLGYNKEEVIGLHLLKLPAITVKGKIIVAKKFADRIRGKVVTPYELEFKAKNGTVLTGLIRASAMYDDNGEISHDLVLITNLSRDEILTSQIADAQRKYKYLFDNIPYAFAYHKVVLSDDNLPTDYIFEEVNENFEKMIGLRSHVIIGKKLSTVLPNIKKDKSNWMDRYSEVVMNRQPQVFEAFSEDLKKWFKVSAYSPEEGYFVSIFQDITDDKNNEDELTQGSVQLAEKVEELSRMNKVMEHRETKIQELKDKINSHKK
ncbi:MAG: PAS domain-containing protein [Patescibacteria group bacterium]|jgi:PAS domain S-box-containing protein